MPVISVRDLVVEYEGRRALNKLNLDIEAGETMVLTLLRGGDEPCALASTSIRFRR
jgi:energy-coupling factor transporter ATP-binding protein EcfA2